MVCDYFKVLPNDERVRKLQPLQIVWIYNNIINKVTEPGKETYGTDEDVFTTRIQKDIEELKKKSKE